MRPFRRRGAAIAFACCLAAACAVRAAAPGGAEGAIRKRLLERYPGSQVESVREVAWPGVYEVQTKDGLVYTDAQAAFILQGPLLDVASGKNLTQERWSEVNRIEFSSLPFADAIKVVKGNGSRVLAVFADPDCPYCQKLEQELLAVHDVTVYTFLFPIVDLHPDARTHAEQIWCSADAPASWAAWMLERKAPAVDSKCADAPVGKLVALGERLRIDATPTLFTADGNRYVGLPEISQLEARLAASLPPAKPALSQ